MQVEEAWKRKDMLLLRQPNLEISERNSAY